MQCWLLLLRSGGCYSINPQLSKLKIPIYIADHTFLASRGYYDGTVRLWDKDSNLMLQELVGHGDQIHSVAFSPDGKQIATGSRDGTARFWSVVSLEQLLNDGCNWLKDYFLTHPKELKKLEFCHQYIKMNFK